MASEIIGGERQRLHLPTPQNSQLPFVAALCCDNLAGVTQAGRDKAGQERTFPQGVATPFPTSVRAVCGLPNTNQVITAALCLAKC